MSKRHARGTLGWWLDERRGELGLTWEQVAERAGVSVQTIFRAINGTPMRTTTRKGIERALEWASGSIDEIERGGSPTVLVASPAPPRYPAEIYERVIRDDTERRIMAERGANEDYKWRVIRILRENAYDAQRSRDDDAQRRLA